MALNEIQWGRILALAWINDNFKNTFEKDPVTAFENLKTSQELSDDVLEELGLSPGAPLSPRLDLETMVWGFDFPGAPGAILDKIVKGQKQVELKEDDWFWTTNGGDATSTQGKVLSLAHWGRIYARMWMDYRIDEPEFAEQKQIYGDKRMYKTEFEINPTKIVTKITQEPQLADIPYTPGITRLFFLIDKPDTWTAQQLETCVKTGTLNGYPLRYIVKKCC